MNREEQVRWLAESRRKMAAMHRQAAARYRQYAAEQDRQAEAWEAKARELSTPADPAPPVARVSDDEILAVLRDHAPCTARTVALLLLGVDEPTAHHSFAGAGYLSIADRRRLFTVTDRIKALARRGDVVRAGRHARDTRQLLWAPVDTVTLSAMPPLVTTQGTR